MNRALFFLACVLISLYSCSGEKTASKEETVLAFHPQKGLQKKLVYEFSLEAPAQKSNLHYTIEADFEVTQSNEESTETKLTYKAIGLTGNVDTVKFDIQAGILDSTQIDGMMYAQPYFTCLNHEFQLSFNRKMIKTAEILLTEKDPESLTEPKNKIQFFTSLPDQPIKEGFTWSDKIELKSGESHLLTAKFTIVKIENNIAHCEFKGDLSADGNQFDLNYAMKGTVYGSFEADLKTGLPIKSEMVQDLILIMSEKESPMKFTIKQYFK